MCLCTAWLGCALHWSMAPVAWCANATQYSRHIHAGRCCCPVTIMAERNVLCPYVSFRGPCRMVEVSVLAYIMIHKPSNEVCQCMLVNLNFAVPILQQIIRPNVETETLPGGHFTSPTLHVSSCSVMQIRQGPNVECATLGQFTGSNTCQTMAQGTALSDISGGRRSYNMAPPPTESSRTLLTE